MDALNLGDYPDKHVYPKGGRPGKDPFTDAAWSILDLMAPNAMTVRDRYMLGGLVAGGLRDSFEIGMTAGKAQGGRK